MKFVVGSVFIGLSVVIGLSVGLSAAVRSCGGRSSPFVNIADFPYGKAHPQAQQPAPMREFEAEQPSRVANQAEPIELDREPNRADTSR